MQSFFQVIVLIISVTSFSYGSILIDVSSEKEILLLSKSKVYFDKDNQENIETIILKPELFNIYNKEYINNGLENKYPIWIKFTLVNSSRSSINRVLSIDNLIIRHLTLYSIKNKKVLEIKKSGFLHREKFRGILQPHFQISIAPNTKQVYLLKVYSPTSPVSFKAVINTQKEFLSQDIFSHNIWIFVLTILIAVMFYNFLLFIFTKDMLYLSYSLYVFGIIIVRDFSYPFWLQVLPLHNINFINSFIQNEPALHVYSTNFIAFTMIFFTQHFLQTKQYQRLHTSLNILILIIVFHSVLSSSTFLPLSLVAPFYLILVFFLFFVGLYTLYKKNKNALYFIFGWSLSLFAWLILLLEGLQVWVVKYDLFYYSFQVLIIIEVFLFSFAIAQYIRRLSKEKEYLSQQLIIQKENENKKLESKVKEKTEHLDIELKKNNLLLQELNHRVKNNMQFTTSLYALKLDGLNDPKVRENLRDVERKVLAMSHVHQLLYVENEFNNVKANDYFKKIVSTIKQSFECENIKFICNVESNLKIEEAIYCGLIVNELVTNAIKYAFLEEKGEIVITLKEDELLKYLEVRDNGVGLKKKNNNGFGTILVEGLATKQLKGKLYINTTNGTEVKISFPKS